MIASLRHRLPWQLALALAAQALFLAHVVSTGYTADDQINASFSGHLANSGISFWDASTDVVFQWLHNEGRFFPIAWYQGFAQFHLVHSVEAYKALLILWTVLSSACVWWLVRELGMDRARAALVVVVTTVAFQFRPNDSLVAYAGLGQSALAWSAISLLFFHRWLVRGQRWYLVGSLLFLLAGSLTYEVGYLYLPLYALIAWRERSRAIAAARALIPVAVLSAAVVIGALILRLHAIAGPNGPYQARFVPKEMLFTFFDQFVGAVPLTAALFDPLNRYSPAGHVLINSMGPMDILVGFSFAVVAMALLRLRGEATAKPGLLALFGLGLWGLSAVPIALAHRYQLELVAGNAHIPVYSEYFAFGILVVAGVEWLVSVSGRQLPDMRIGGVPLAILLSGVVVGSLATVAHRANAVVAAELHAAKDGRQMIEDAGAAGLFDPVPTDAKLYADPANQVNSAAFYRMVAGRRFDVQPVSPELVKTLPHDRQGCRDGWLTRDVYLGDGQGYVTLSCVGIGPARMFLWGVSRRRALIAWRVRVQDGARPLRMGRARRERVMDRKGHASAVLRGLELAGPTGFVEPYSISVATPSAG